MTRWTTIFRLELRHAIVQPATGLVLGALLIAMLVAGFVGGERVQRQTATLDRVAQEEQQSIERAQAAFATYSRPGDLVIPLFRDPTDAYSYYFNFLTAYATNPPGVLAPIAVGQSDLQPNHVRINPSAVFPDSAYELRGPRGLALGAFDLAFVVVFLLPLAVIALAGPILSREHDSGVLRLIAAQPVSPRRVATAKFAALGLVLSGAVGLSTLAALIVAGVPLGDGGGAATLVVCGLAVAYAVFWLAVSLLWASFWRGGVRTLAGLVLTWAGLVLVVPALGALVVQLLVPGPSRLDYIDTSRAAADQLSSSWANPALAARWLDGRPDLAVADRQAAIASDGAGRLARGAFMREQLAGPRQAFAVHAERTIRASDAFRFLSPPAVVDGAFQALAETDAASQRRFLAEVDAHAARLQAYFEPLILANAGRPRPCETCPGRLNFSTYDAVPDQPRTQRPTDLGPALTAIAYLLLLSAGLTTFALSRLRRWPLGN